jgi:hypothetical protein
VVGNLSNGPAFGHLKTSRSDIVFRASSTKITRQRAARLFGQAAKDPRGPAMPAFSGCTVALPRAPALQSAPRHTAVIRPTWRNAA